MLKSLLLVALSLPVASGLFAAERPQAWSFEILERTDTLTALARGMAGERPQQFVGKLDSQGFWYERVMKLGRNPRYRHEIARVINARGGYLDRQINAKLLEKEWAMADVPNEAAVTAALERGGEPNARGMLQLKSMGITTVVNFRMEDNDEETMVKKLGMTPVWLPIPDTSAPTVDQVKKFIELVDQPGVRVYCHCSAGIFRTGTMVAAYRIAHGMPLDQALAEAKAHKFDPEWLNADTEVAFLTALAGTYGSPK